MTYPSYTKLKKDKQPNQCPHCNGFNTYLANCNELPNVMYCKDCDSSWLEYEDKWSSVFEQGRIIK